MQTDIFDLEKRGNSSRLYLDALTGLRGIAAIWVALWHTWGFSGRPLYEVSVIGMQFDLTPLIRTGWAGVDIFFVLSGFVLGLPFCQAWLGRRSPLAMSDYFRRRLLRVLPAYYVQLLILVIIAWWVNGMHSIPPGDLLAHILMLHNVFTDAANPINPVYWTLPVEFNFYLVLPLLALWVSPRYWGWLLAGSLVVVIAYRYLVFWNFLLDAGVQQKVWWLNQLPGRLDQFVSGMLAAYLYSVIREKGFTFSAIYRRRREVLVFSLASLLVLAYLIHISQPMGSDNMLGQTFWGGHWTLYLWHSLMGFALGAFILAIALGVGMADRLLANRAVMFLGLISYSIYLWHFPIISWINKAHLPVLIKGYPFLNLTLWVTVPVLLVSAISYWLVERPFLAVRHKA